MSGIYIHVPFCHRKCAYCDFYSVGKNSLNDDFPKLIVQEMEQRRNFLPDKNIETIYFGGGTPSLLPASYVEQILNGIGANFSVVPNPEVTLEANPDDITEERMQGYKKIGINRISVGIQSFIDSELEFLGRRHNAQRAIDCITNIKTAGINNISIDLIYGIPHSTTESWMYSLNQAMTLDVQHLSCYHLTYEESTPLTRKLQKGTIRMIDEELSVQQFETLRKITGDQGFEHYEISNFARKGYISRHNSAYWLNTPYLGVGPSAHSYNISSRQWNPRSIGDWSTAIGNGQPLFESETIDETTRFNELLITRLRTIWGVNLQTVANEFKEVYTEHLQRLIAEQIRQGNLTVESNTILRIPPERYIISDAILANLMYD
ncbi:MAG: radical SAM family heme chaperone HemW [Bacteroidales bacterium]|nr:radical SAM family heme chaperone HemW [Bacteroidales bacterium]